MTQQLHQIAHQIARYAPADRIGTIDIVCTCGRSFAGHDYDAAEQIWRAHRTTAQQQIDAADASTIPVNPEWISRLRSAADVLRDVRARGYVGACREEAFEPAELERIADDIIETATIEALNADIDAAVTSYLAAAPEFADIDNSAIARKLYEAGWRRTDAP
jgi:hypothetical protein